jgi:hypothetical protein
MKQEEEEEEIQNSLIRFCIVFKKIKTLLFLEITIIKPVLFYFLLSILFQTFCFFAKNYYFYYFFSKNPKLNCMNKNNNKSKK